MIEKSSDEILSWKFVNYPTSIILGNSIHHLRFKIKNQMNSSQKFTFQWKGEKIEFKGDFSSSQDHSFSKQEEKVMEVPIQPVENGEARLEILVIHHKEIKIIEREWQFRSQIDPDFINQIHKFIPLPDVDVLKKLDDIKEKVKPLDISLISKDQAQEEINNILHPPLPPPRTVYRKETRMVTKRIPKEIIKEIPRTFTETIDQPPKIDPKTGEKIPQPPKLQEKTVIEKKVTTVYEEIEEPIIEEVPETIQDPAPPPPSKAELDLIYERYARGVCSQNPDFAYELIHHIYDNNKLETLLNEFIPCGLKNKNRQSITEIAHLSNQNHKNQLYQLAIQSFKSIDLNQCLEILTSISNDKVRDQTFLYLVKTTLSEETAPKFLSWTDHVTDREMRKKIIFQICAKYPEKLKKSGKNALKKLIQIEIQDSNMSFLKLCALLLAYYWNPRKVQRFLQKNMNNENFLMIQDELKNSFQEQVEIEKTRIESHEIIHNGYQFSVWAKNYPSEIEYLRTIGGNLSSSLISGKNLPKILIISPFYQNINIYWHFQHYQVSIPSHKQDEIGFLVYPDPHIFEKTNFQRFLNLFSFIRQKYDNIQNNAPLLCVLDLVSNIQSNTIFIWGNSPMQSKLHILKTDQSKSINISVSSANNVFFAQGDIYHSLKEKWHNSIKFINIVFNNTFLTQTSNIHELFLQLNRIS